MNFLLDTNVISDSTKPWPSPELASWLAQVDEDSVFLSVVTLTELRYGIERMAAGGRRKRLDAWLHRDLPLRFEGRILPIDAIIADACGGLVSRSESAGRPIQPRDAFIAATAEVYGLTLVTRNASDFLPVLKAVLNPWSSNT
jgi:predicted nucleic acid-binding protein